MRDIINFRAFYHCQLPMNFQNDRPSYRDLLSFDSQLLDLEFHDQSRRRLTNHRQFPSFGCAQTLGAQNRAEIQREVPRDFSSQSSHSPQKDNSKWELRFTQNSAILSPKSTTKTFQQIEVLPYFKRIFKKLTSTYLKQIISSKKKSEQSVYTFQNSSLLSNENLTFESSAEGYQVIQKISHLSLPFERKSKLKGFLRKFRSLRSFFDEAFSMCGGFEETNEEFLYVLNLFLECLGADFCAPEDQQESVSGKDEQGLKSATSAEEHCNSDTKSSPCRSASYQKSNRQFHSAKDCEQEIKSILEAKKFVETVYFDSAVKYISFRGVFLENLSEERLRELFFKFIKLFSHLLVKLLIIDTINGQFSLLYESECESKGSNSSLESKGPKVFCCPKEGSYDLMNHWLVAGSVKSFKSISSLSSININNLHGVKLYSSKADLWSSSQSQRSLEEEKYGGGIISKKKNKKSEY